MNTLPKRLSIYGGLNTSEAALEKLGKAIVGFGFTTPDAFVQVFTLGEAGRNRQGAASAAEGSLAVAHSMGNLIWKAVNKDKIVPQGAIAFNRTMPASLGRLVVGGADRFAHHLARSAAGPDAPGHRQIVRDTLQSFGDPSGNLGRVPEVVPYSSDEQLEALALRTPVAAVISVRDEFGSAYSQMGTAPGVSYQEDTLGCHDGALYAPLRTLKLVEATGVLPRDLTQEQ